MIYTFVIDESYLDDFIKIFISFTWHVDIGCEISLWSHGHISLFVILSIWMNQIFSSIFLTFHDDCKACVSRHWLPASVCWQRDKSNVRFGNSHDISLVHMYVYSIWLQTLKAESRHGANFCRNWWHRRLSLRQPVVPPVTTQLASWRLSIPSVWWDMNDIIASCSG